LRSPRARRGGFGKSWQAERNWYLVHEKGGLRPKEPARLEVALGFPNRYPVGMSNLGFQAVYGLLNSLEGVRCERFFLWETGVSRTLESGRSLAQFSMVAFTVPFELDYLNFLEILHRARIPALASQRKKGHPLICVGGPCAFLNPEPLAPFVDFFVVGEGESILPSLLEIFQFAGSKKEILEASVRVPGIYAPCFYQVSYLPDGRIEAIRHKPPAPDRVKRQWISDLNSCLTVSPIITPLSHFQDMCLVEAQRGCGHGCRFCAMGFIYRPVRHRSLDSLSLQIQEAKKRSQRVGLVGSAVSDLPHLEDLCLVVASHCDGLGISSLRADRLTPSLLKRLSRLGMRTITIAPEVGSERMRRVINKTVTQQDVLQTAAFAGEAGIRQLKLYFMMGLPEEREEDVVAIRTLVENIRQVPGLRKIAISVSAFVPKASTPFQWAQMMTEAELRRKMLLLAQGLRPLKGVTFAGESARRSLWQGVLAMGDRRVGQVLWHRQMEGLTWNRAWRKVGVERDFYVHRERSHREVLPWEIIDHGISKAKLWAEYMRAKSVAG